MRAISTTEEFIQKAKEIYGDKYDYSYSKYMGCNGKLKIICPEHGVFEQVEGDHLNGVGCPSCDEKKIGDAIGLTQEEFIQRVKEIHGDKYKHSPHEYTGYCGKLKIICPEHGVFEQTSCNYLHGFACPGCRLERLKKTHKIRGWHGFNKTKPILLYLIRFEKPFACFWKVGITSRTIKKRFGNDFAFIASQYSWKLNSVCDAKEIEEQVLNKFNKYKFDGSFLFSILDGGGKTECFTPSLPHKKVISFVERQIKLIHQN